VRQAAQGELALELLLAALDEHVVQVRIHDVLRPGVW